MNYSTILCTSNDIGIFFGGSGGVGVDGGIEHCEALKMPMKKIETNQVNKRRRWRAE